MHWRLILSPPMRGAENMALDEALLDRARMHASSPAGALEGVVRVYAWSRPTLSLGRHQVARDAYDAPLAAARGVDIVRRPTGGRALLHHHEVTYSVTAPIVPGTSLRAAYDEINAVLLEVLRALGVEATVASPTTRAIAPGIAPCFEHPAAGELVVAGRKLVGSAQYREGSAYLQHGSILVRDDQHELAALSRRPLGDVPPAATLLDAIGREPTPAEFAEHLAAVLRRRWDVDAEHWSPDAELLARAATLRARYVDDAWTWRR